MLVFNEIRQSTKNEFSMLLNGYFATNEVWSCHGYFPDTKDNRRILEEVLLKIREYDYSDLEQIREINNILEQLDESLVIPFNEEIDSFGEIEGYDVSFVDKKGKVYDVDIMDEEIR